MGYLGTEEAFVQLMEDIRHRIVRLGYKVAQEAGNGTIDNKKDDAPLIGRSVRTLNRWISEGLFPKGRYVRGSMYWTLRDLEKWRDGLPKGFC